MDQFLHEMEEIRKTAVNDLAAGKYGRLPFGGENPTEASKRPEVIFFLQLGVYPEWREVHFLSRQIQRLDDADMVYRIGEQIFDEAKHTKVLRDQLMLWGADPDRFWQQPIPQWAAAFDYMDKLTHPAEYFGCSNFIGEGLFLASVMNPMKTHDPETFNVYVEHILPDEPRHIKIGRDIIIKYCTTHEMQERVRRSAIILAKQYCQGYDAATKFAIRAMQGDDPGQIRDGEVILPTV
ncbi:hypothetical protein IAD21_06408 (plasmid) [Abditibacteriota bacterium]|nr:hypothetical protein IAD21_06408 [Abditibacteriota bacterium]